MSVTSITETTQYLTFRLGDEIFALDISKVREVLDYTNITKVPRTPDFMRGVINLRGNVVPVVDMRLKFGMTKTERTVNTCIIIVEITLEGETTVLGALTDAVQEVIELGPEQIEPAPKIGTRLNTEFIKGMGKRDDHFIIILNIDRVFSADELSLVQDAGSVLTPPTGSNNA
jgi:purine-binding chemotaxis protein CheW